MFLLFEASLTNSVDPDHTAPPDQVAPVGPVWVHTVCVYTYIKQ